MCSENGDQFDYEMVELITEENNFYLDQKIILLHQLLRLLQAQPLTL